MGYTCTDESLVLSYACVFNNNVPMSECCLKTVTEVKADLNVPRLRGERLYVPRPHSSNAAVQKRFVIRGGFVSRNGGKRQLVLAGSMVKHGARQPHTIVRPLNTTKESCPSEGSF